MSNANQSESYGELFSGVEANQPDKDAEGQAAIDRAMDEVRKYRQEEELRKEQEAEEREKKAEEREKKAEEGKEREFGRTGKTKTPEDIAAEDKVRAEALEIAEPQSKESIEEQKRKEKKYHDRHMTGKKDWQGLGNGTPKDMKKKPPKWKSKTDRRGRD